MCLWFIHLCCLVCLSVCLSVDLCMSCILICMSVHTHLYIRCTYAHPSHPMYGPLSVSLHEMNGWIGIKYIEGLTGFLLLLGELIDAADASLSLSACYVCVCVSDDDWTRGQTTETEMQDWRLRVAIVVRVSYPATPETLRAALRSCRSLPTPIFCFFGCPASRLEASPPPARPPSLSPICLSRQI